MEETKHRRPTASDLSKYLDKPDRCPSCTEVGQLIKHAIEKVDDEGWCTVKCDHCRYSFYEIHEQDGDKWTLIDIELEAPEQPNKKKREIRNAEDIDRLMRYAQ